RHSGNGPGAFHLRTRVLEFEPVDERLVERHSEIREQLPEMLPRRARLPELRAFLRTPPAQGHEPVRERRGVPDETLLPQEECRPPGFGPFEMMAVAPDQGCSDIKNNPANHA